MANMSLKKNEMPVQKADERNKNFDEVALGYTKEQAVDEAKRCLNCKHKPCVSGCPVGIDIPAFISKVAEEDFEGAYEIIYSSSSLPAVCGRVCPQETQCEAKCVRGIKGEPVAIGRLERFVADFHMQNSKPSQKAEISKIGKKVAVIGSGPAGLACAGDLAKMGYSVTVFEALHVAGGVLVYGIPEFRLPKNIVKREIEELKALDVEFVTNAVIGKTLTIDELFDMGFEAVFIGSGAGLPRFMNIPGENLNGVYSANEFLTRTNLMKAYKEDSDTPIMKADSVAVVGGGNVAMDAARCAKRLGADKVYVVYRRSMQEMPARREEVEHAEEEGIIFLTLNNPVEILGDDNNFVKGIKCIKMELGQPDESGRRSPVEVTGSEYVLDVDAVVMSIGTSPNPLIRSTTEGLETDRRGCIVAEDETGQTSRKGVFAGGDAVTGAATVILAMGAGKKAAKAIDEYINNK
ncbi:MAG: NADPH-dependent glutamate synthase [Clostridia bacterium]|nr:NADPH-dependent glutamate synthase [Clostridia bacterium]